MQMSTVLIDGEPTTFVSFTDDEWKDILATPDES